MNRPQEKKPKRPVTGGMAGWKTSAGVFFSETDSRTGDLVRCHVSPPPPYPLRAPWKALPWIVVSIGYLPFMSVTWSR